MKGKKIDIILSIILVGLVVTLITMLILSVTSHKKAAPACEDGWYSYTDGNVINNVYLEAMDTCKERK